MLFSKKSELLIKTQQYDNALDLYKKVIKINPNYTQTYFDIGLCLDKLGKQREAKRYYHKFLAARPNDENAHYAMRRVENLKKLPKSQMRLSIV